MMMTMTMRMMKDNDDDDEDAAFLEAPRSEQAGTRCPKDKAAGCERAVGCRRWNSAGVSAPLLPGVVAAPVASVPSELVTRVAGCLSGGLDLLSEQTVERAHEIVRRASLDDFPKRVGEAE